MLRRDNSPKKLPNGQADLRKFQNRFPQIAKGARLLKKKKRVLGKPGFKVSGVMIEPPLPEDFDLQALAGEGTRVENQGVNEFIVATRDGFLSLDVETNHIAVTEKIENKSGVSVKTTGDLESGRGRVHRTRRGAGGARRRRQEHDLPFRCLWRRSFRTAV